MAINKNTSPTGAAIINARSAPCQGGFRFPFSIGLDLFSIVWKNDLFFYKKEKEIKSMIDSYTDLVLKNVNQDKFKKWFDKKIGGFASYDPEEDGLGVEVEGGYGYYFWEAISLMMVEQFEEIVFYGTNEIYCDDHLVRTRFECDGKKVQLERTIEFPDNDDSEDDGWKEIITIENDVPYSVSFSTADISACAKAYKELDKKLKDTTLVKNVCAIYGITEEKIKQYATILNFKKR
jgi:hypothetical protein